MTRFTHQLLTYALLVAYGSVSLLGQGLHLLSAGHGLHVGDNVVECVEHHSHEEHGLAHHGHGGDAAPADEATHASGLAIQSRECNTQSHACEVCQFLGQVRSVPPAFVLAATPAQVADYAPHSAEATFSPVSLGPQAPRGPPAALFAWTA
jgi:hypothetical protein